MEINVGDYYFEIDNWYILLILFILGLGAIFLYRKKKNFYIFPLVIAVFGLLLKGHSVTLNIYDINYSVSYFYIGLLIATLSSLVYFIFAKNTSKI